MSIINDFTRSQWMNKIAALNSRPVDSLSNWLKQGKDYTLNNVSSAKAFSLHIVNYDALVDAVAFDFNRFSQSSVETLENCHFSNRLVKSKGWPLIKIYYAAFFAAHSILRVFGKGMLQMDDLNLRMIWELSAAINPAFPLVEKGFYYYEIDYSSSLISFTKATRPDGGAHEKFWKVYHKFNNDLGNSVLRYSSSPEANQVFDRLNDISNNLSYVGNNNGTWLCQVRNEVNYRHRYGVWFPYAGYQDYYDQIAKIVKMYKKDPLSVPLSSYAGREVLRFSSTCVFLVAFSNSINKELDKRCPSGKSFVNFGALSFANFLDA